MTGPTNLTDRISHLRDRKGGSEIVNGNRPTGEPPSSPRKTSRERKFATDYFMLFAYALLGIAIVCQLVLIVWLDII